VRLLKKLLQSLLLLPLWISITENFGPWVFNAEYFQIFPAAGIALSALAIIYPRKFAMGINGYMVAKFYEKLLPLAVSILFLLFLGTVKQTFSIVFLSTFFVSASVTYASWVVVDTVVNKLLKSKK
jgi:hypothetical protein